MSRPHPLPTAAPPLEDENLLSEILLRLPPQPSSLPRASLVSNRWRRIASDPGFFRRFRRHHRPNPPLLGFFDMYGCRSFVPTLEAPDRVPPGRFSLQRGDDDWFRPLGSRHGLVLILNRPTNQLLVWDPVTGDKHWIAVPPGFGCDSDSPIGGAVLRSAVDDHHFLVALVSTTETQDHTRAIASAYLSETNTWSDIISTPLPPASESRFQLQAQDLPPFECPTMISCNIPAVLVGDSLYWWLRDSSYNILQFDLDRDSLAVIPAPVDLYDSDINFSVMRADDGGLGFLFVSKFSVQLWKTKVICDCFNSWVLGRTIEMDKLFLLDSKKAVSSCSSLSRCSSRSSWKPESLSINHSKVSILQKQALVVDMMELISCTAHKKIFRLGMLCDVLVE
ncbi:putative F-box protein At3g49980 isoform X3 [Triticum aestivum]|uniref:putative F-box protein At3g49980 isoform X3 n=1 Tax=Triticum aestivum TaxID=4565 RepID=UPI001D01DEFB|nr:putative F-box protein At3g49980 isoform X3 [Triticum aestivum]